MTNNQIFIETSYILKNKTGIGTYALKLMQIISNLNIEYSTKEINVNLPYRYIWQTIWLNTVFYLETLIKRPKCCIFPNFIMPFMTRKKTKYYTVIHDLCSLRTKEMSLYNRFIFNLSIGIAIKKADTIIVVSESVKNELIEKYNMNPEKIKVVYNSISEHFINAENKTNLLSKYGLEKNKYILSIATLNKRKNIPELIKAFEKISDKYSDLKLVLVGGMGNEQKEKLAQHPNIIFTGYIPDEVLPTLYKNALLYMYPSLYEGFGIPMIEAQYCGCPVLCSDIPVFREVAEKSAEFCIPSTESIAENLENLINNPERRKELTDLGYNNVTRFYTEKITEQLGEVLNA